VIHRVRSDLGQAQFPETVALARDLASELLREDLDETRWQRVQSRVAERDLSMAMDRLSAY
jgi:hypothetical protein